MNTPWIVVAVDGQAASGKGTISRHVAEALNLCYLDTGKLYRTLAYYLVKKRRKRLYARDRAAFEFFCASRRPTDDELQSEFISRFTPSVAQQPWARQLLLSVQREFASIRRLAKSGAILDGRDIGTVVCPEADVKIFVVADVEERARRRLDQLAKSGMRGDIKKILKDLVSRDLQDSSRAVAPSKPAKDAHILDTTHLSVEESVKWVVDVVLARMGD